MKQLFLNIYKEINVIDFFSEKNELPVKEK